MKRTALLLALLCLPALLAAAPHWAPLGPYGGLVYSVAVDPSDARIVYASLAGGWRERLCKSTDGGIHWTTILDSAGQVVVDPERHDTLYLNGVGGELLRSADGGGSWTGIGPGSSGPFVYVSGVAIDPVRPSRIYAASMTGIWLSTDRGDSWTQTPLSMGDVVFAVRRPAGTVFAGGGGSLHKSTDGGLTWHAFPPPRGVRKAVLFAVAPSDARWLYAGSDSAGLFRSTDGGKTWRSTGRQPETGDTIAGFAVSPSSPRSLWLITRRRGLYRSTDGGDTWQATGPSPARQHVLAVALAPSSPGTVYAGVEYGIWAGKPDPGGVLASDDGGRTWRRSNQGMTGLDAIDVAVDPRNPSILWATNAVGLFRSTNGGLDWTQKSTRWGSIVIDPAAPDTLFIGQEWNIFYTHDGGDSWSRSYSPNGPDPHCVPYGPEYWWCLGGMSFLALGPEQPPKLWAGTNEGELFTSSDQGAHWNRVNLPRAPCYISDLRFAPSSPDTLYTTGEQSGCGDDTGHAAFFRSADGGATWQNAGADLRRHPFQEGQRIAIDPVDPRLVYLATWSFWTDEPGDGVWKSADGGSTWVQAGDQLAGLSILDVVASPVAGALWASTYPISDLDGSRIFRSGDGGATWQERSAGLPVGIFDQLVIDPLDPRRIYAAGSGGVWRLTAPND